MASAADARRLRHRAGSFALGLASPLATSPVVPGEREAAGEAHDWCHTETKTRTACRDGRCATIVSCRAKQTELRLTSVPGRRPGNGPLPRQGAPAHDALNWPSQKGASHLIASDGHRGDRD